MIKLKATGNTSSVSLNGKEYIVKDGILEIEQDLKDLLLGHGFESFSEPVLEPASDLNNLEVVSEVKEKEVIETPKKTKHQW